jgi:hypothetical protein
VFSRCTIMALNVWIFTTDFWSASTIGRSGVLPDKSKGQFCSLLSPIPASR